MEAAGRARGGRCRAGRRPWPAGAELDAIARNALAACAVREALRQHVELTAISTFFVLVVAIPLGILLTCGALRRAAPLVTALANAGQAAPASGLLALLVIRLGIGRRAALIGLILHALLPVLGNTVASLRSIDPALVDAARGIGMSPADVLLGSALTVALALLVDWPASLTELLLRPRGLETE